MEKYVECVINYQSDYVNGEEFLLAITEAFQKVSPGKFYQRAILKSVEFC